MLGRQQKIDKFINCSIWYQSKGGNDFPEKFDVCYSKQKTTNCFYKSRQTCIECLQ